MPKESEACLEESIQKCITFILEMDKLKSVKRRSPLLDNSRAETDAEHSWHAAMSALLLSSFSEESIDREKVIRMMLIHDIVEIDAGDTFLYDTEHAQSQEERELEAGQRLYGLLPSDLRDELFSLWQEFEAGETAEAKFAKGLDRLQPLLQNYFSGGGTWNLPGVHREDVLSRKSVIKELGPSIWAFAQSLIEDGATKGWLRQHVSQSQDIESAQDEDTSHALEIFSNLQTITIDKAPAKMKEAAREFEIRFQRKFETLTHLPNSLLDFLHKPVESGDNSLAVSGFHLSIASDYDKSVVNCIETMSKIANLENPSKPDNLAFFDAVISIYDRLRGGLSYLSSLDDTFCIAPEREGRMIADRLGVLPLGRTSKPNAKRIPYEEGLVVGHDLSSPNKAFYQRCVIVDGAIASGSTLIAMIEMLRASTQEFHVFSAHATASSVRALSVYAAANKIKLYLNLGHVSGQLNHKRYALHPDGSLVIGDLGDLISPAVE
ncbi:HD domain-containing protein [Alteromonadaceae bacterium M269]|nr:HD domain-containing protein [Alteromonadaceae bacterium M269]